MRSLKRNGRMLARVGRALAVAAIGAALFSPHVARAPRNASSSFSGSLSTLAHRFSLDAEARAMALGWPPFTYMTAMRSDVGMIIGYGDHDFYVENSCALADPPPSGTNDCVDAPPYKGIVGTMVDSLNHVQDLFASAGFATCDALPTAGNFNATDANGNSVILTMGNPTHAVPAGWTDSGSAFDHRVQMDSTISGSAIKMAFEFSCGKPSGFVAVNMLVGAHAPGFERRINIFFGQDASRRAVDLFFTEYNPQTLGTRGVSAVYLRVNDATQEFVLDNIRTGDAAVVSAIDKILLHGNYATNQLSAYFERFTVAKSGDAYDPSALDTFADANNDQVQVSTSFDFDHDWCQYTQLGMDGRPQCNTSLPDEQAGNTFTMQGCVDMAHPNATLASATLCNGLALEAPDKPVLDGNGAFSALWSLRDMSAKIDVTGLTVQ